MSYRAHVGVGIKERKRLQEIRVDIELGLDLRPAGRLDRVDRTLDYAAITRDVKALIQGRSFRLVEALAQAIADCLVDRFNPRWVRVRLRKFSVPGTDSVGVEITRSNLRKR